MILRLVRSRKQMAPRIIDFNIYKCTRHRPSSPHLSTMPRGSTRFLRAVKCSRALERPVLCEDSSRGGSHELPLAILLGECSTCRYPSGELGSLGLFTVLRRGEQSPVPLCRVLVASSLGEREKSATCTDASPRMVSVSSNSSVIASSWSPLTP
ncbi:hypothetical protein LY78DRAFT_180613 [Colletotrichum sublineola]|nr:hypothetical protein LY78DRAFT_180613 [Colletotrichum sublineola]